MYSAPYSLNNNVGGTRDPVVASTVIGVIALLTTIIRVYSRTIQSIPLALDDWLAMAALAWSFVPLGLQWACTIRAGSGYHVADINPLSVVLVMKVCIISSHFTVQVLTWPLAPRTCRSPLCLRQCFCEAFHIGALLSTLRNRSHISKKRLDCSDHYHCMGHARRA